jgi:hypothetical protein
MKKAIFIFIFLLIGMGLNTGCKVLDVIEDFDFEVKLVAYSATADFSDQDLINLDSLSYVIADYGDKIKEIEILEATVNFSDIGDPSAGMILSATLTVADENGAGEETVCSVTNQEIAVLPIPQPLTLNEDGIARFEELIKNSPHKALVKYFGNADGTPVDFTAEFKFKVKMTANPL